MTSAATITQTQASDVSVASEVSDAVAVSSCCGNNRTVRSWLSSSVVAVLSGSVVVVVSSGSVVGVLPGSVVVVERLTDGSVGRLEPEPAHAVIPMETTTAAASARRRRRPRAHLLVVSISIIGSSSPPLDRFACPGHASLSGRRRRARHRGCRRRGGFSERLGTGEFVFERLERHGVADTRGRYPQVALELLDRVAEGVGPLAIDGAVPIRQHLEGCLDGGI